MKPARPAARCLSFSVLVAFAAVLASKQGAAAGETPSEPRYRTRIAYSAPSTCPDEQAFLALVRAKTRGDWLAGPSEPARTLTVTVREQPEQSVATVSLVDPQGRPVSREISGKTCEAAVNAIALVAAIAVESQTFPDETESTPDAAAVGEAKPADGASETNRNPAAPSSPGRVQETATPASPRTRVAPTPAASTATPGREHERGARPRFRAEVGADGSTRTRAGPDLSWGGSAFVGFDAPQLASHMRVSMGYSDTGRVDVAGAAARFRLLTARGSLCPVESIMNEFASAHLCAAAEAGALFARGYQSPSVVSDERATRLWAALGAEGRLRIAGPHAFGEIGLRVDAPLVRREFAFNRPFRPVYSIPLATGSLVAGFGVEFF